MSEDTEIIVKSGQNQRFDINGFRSEIKRNSVLHTHSYLVQFAPFSINSKLNRYMDADSRNLVMRCDSAILPGIDLLTNDNIRRYGYGPVESAAHNVQFGQARFTWIVDSDAKVISFFNDWMSSIVNFGSDGGNSMLIPDDLSEDANFYPYEVSYKDDYSNSNMKIFVYDHRNDTVAEYQLFDVFPQRVEDVPMSWSDTDSIVRLSVQFAYTDMRISTPKVSSASGLGANEFRILTAAIDNI